jgi:hypothetical protein
VESIPSVKPSINRKITQSESKWVDTKSICQFKQTQTHNTKGNPMKNTVASFLLGVVVTTALLLFCPWSVARAQSTPTRTPVATPTPSGTTATVLRDANLRAGPGTTYAVVGGVKIGDRVTIVDANSTGDWYELSNGNWIAAFLVDVTTTTLPTPTTTPTLTKEQGLHAEAWSILEEAEDLIEAGYEMQSLRGSDDLAIIRQCGQTMRQLIARSDALRDRADLLPSMNYGLVKTVAIEARLCIVCSDNAIEACDIAAADLDLAKSAMADVEAVATVAPSPTRTPAPTTASTPATTALTRADREYIRAASAAYNDIAQGLVALALLFDEPRSEDEDWRLDVTLHGASVMLADKTAQDLQAPAKFADLHEGLLLASESCAGFAMSLTYIIDSDELAAFETAAMQRETCLLFMGFVKEDLTEIQTLYNLN